MGKVLTGSPKTIGKNKKGRNFVSFNTAGRDLVGKKKKITEPAKGRRKGEN